MPETRNPDQQYGVPLGIYQERYKTLDPEETVRRAGVPFDAARGVFTLTVLDFQIDAAWPEFSFVPRDPEACPHALYNKEALILVIRYLLEGTKAESTGAFLPYRELPWGDVYDKNFQGRCRARLAFGFGNTLEAFKKACEALGGIPHDKGDASYDLPVLPGLTVRLILWSGDDEFPPQSQWLFSDNMPLAFTAEDVACMGDVIIGALKEMAKK